MYIVTLIKKFSVIYTYLYKLNNSCVSGQLLSTGEISGIAQLEYSDQASSLYPFSVFGDFYFVYCFYTSHKFNCFKMLLVLEGSLIGQDRENEKELNKIK